MFGDFAESESLSLRFEEVGYDSSNFFLLIGALLLLILAFLAWILIRKPL